MPFTHRKHSTSHRFTAGVSHGRLSSIIGLVVATAVVFGLDSMTDLPHVQHLYYFPIIVAGIRFGLRGGTGAAVVAIFLYHLANPQTLAHFDESDILQIGVFVGVGIVTAKLSDDARRLHQLAMTDDLTGLHNLRSFEFQLRNAIHAAHLAKTPVSMLVLDVDRLKSLNDVHGHLSGSEAVRTVGGIIATHLPADGVGCRFGGDEFAIALPNCPASRARQVAHDLRRAVQATAPLLAGVSFPEGTLSVSVGIACRAFDRGVDRPDVDGESEALFRAADAALYTAKNGGRNRVHVA
jgi:diguanylate cyclase (GGDEF)-like protein